MFNTRWSKIFRDLWMYKARTLLIIAAIAVGVATFGMTATAQIVLDRDLRDGYLATNPAHAVISIPEFDDALIERVGELDEVETVESRYVVSAKIALGNGEWVTGQLQAIPDFNGLTISRFVPDSAADDGLTPPTGSLWLERSLLKIADESAGESVRILMNDGTEHEVDVMGLVNDLEPLPSDIFPWAYGYLSPETMALLDESYDAADAVYNRLYLVTTADKLERDAVERAVTQVVKTIEQEGYTVLRVAVPEPGKPIIQDSLKAGMLLMIAVGLLSLALSAFLVINVMSAMISQQIPQIGMIKSLGGRRRQISHLYLQMVLILGLLALLVAVPIGMGGAYLLAAFLAQNFDFDILTFGLPWPVLGWQVVSAIAVPLLAALAPVLSGARITIRQAISDQGGEGFISPSLARIKGLPQLLNLSLRNIFRKRGRMALTLTALGFGGGMFIAVLGIRQSMYVAADDIGRELNFDVQIDLEQLYTVEEVEAAIQDVAGVAKTESWLVVDSRRVYDDERTGGSFLLVGVPSTTEMVRPFVREGRWLRPDDEDGIFMNATTANLVGGVVTNDSIRLQVGPNNPVADVLTEMVRDNLENVLQEMGVWSPAVQRVVTIDLDNQHAWHVVGSSGWLAIQQAHVRYEDLALMTGMDGFTNRLVIRAEQRGPATQSAVEKRLLARFEEEGIQVYESWTQGKTMQAIDVLTHTLSSLQMLMAVLIATVGGLGVASTMGLNVLERTREIGVLRSLGAKGNTVRRMVIMEGIAISLLSFALAVPLSIPIGLVLGDEVGQRMWMRPLEYTFSWSGMLLWLGILIFIAVVASLLPANNAAKLTIRETLAYNG